MSEQRDLPLRALAKTGRFGAIEDAPGVRLTLRHPVSLVQVLARKTGVKDVPALLAALKKVDVMQAGPGQFYVQAEGRKEGALFDELQAKLAGKASVVDQSHGRVVIALSGRKSRAVLAKGCPVDFHPDKFAIGQSALSQMAHVGVHITRTGADAFAISVFRGFSESLWEWLCNASAEFGYQVD